MKTLDEIEKEISYVKEQIKCQEIGNDSYYLSALYHEQLLRLEALEEEASVLSGKSVPIEVDFDKYPPEKCNLLKKIAEQNGICFANNYKDLNIEDLRFLNNLCKKIKKNENSAGH